MLDRFAAMVRSRRATRLLAVLCGIFTIATVLVGLRDVAGYALGFLAAAMLYILITRRWRFVRSFVILFIVCFAGIILLSFIHVEVVTRLALAFGGIGALASPLLRVPELIVTYVIVFGGVTGLFFGLAGACILGGARLAERRSAAE